MLNRTGLAGGAMKRLRLADGAGQDGGATTETQEQPPADTPAPDDGADTLGDAGKRALQAERAARRDAEKRAKDLEAKLAEAAPGGAGHAAELERLRGELADLRGQSVRDRIARKHGLTDENAELLAGDEAAMDKLAAALAKGQEKRFDKAGLRDQFAGGAGAAPPANALEEGRDLFKKFSEKRKTG